MEGQIEIWIEQENLSKFMSTPGKVPFWTYKPEGYSNESLMKMSISLTEYNKIVNERNLSHDGRQLLND